MGLDISCGGVSFRAGSYSGFNQFRRVIAKNLGIELDEMEGYGQGTKSWLTVEPGIAVLLSHSDCEGTISPTKAKKLLVALQNYKHGVAQKLYNVLHSDPEERAWINEKVDNWIEACEESIKTQDPIHFH